MAALPSRCGHYIFCPVVSIFLSSFSSPNLSGRRVDICHTSPHIIIIIIKNVHSVALVRIWNAGLKYAARGSLEVQDAKMTQKSPSAHHRTHLSG